MNIQRFRHYSVSRSPLFYFISCHIEFNRNLCAIDWVKLPNHNHTEEEFNAYWNGLSADERKVHLHQSLTFFTQLIDFYQSYEDGSNALVQVWSNLFSVSISQ